MPLQNRLKEFRAAQGINQQELGTLVGASRQTISLIERGDYNPSITLALRIAQVFHLPVEDVFYLTEEESSSSAASLAASWALPLCPMNSPSAISASSST